MSFPMEPGSEKAPPPRVLIVMDEQWPRALLRAAMLEAGYDAVGARSLAEALGYPAKDPDRGPVRLVIVDDHAVKGDGVPSITLVLSRHGNPATLLLARATQSVPEGPWQRVLRRPCSVGDIVAAVRDLLPPASTSSGSVD